MNKTHIPLILILSLLSASFALADFNVREDYNYRQNSIYNAEYVNATYFYMNGTLVGTGSGSGGIQSVQSNNSYIVVDNGTTTYITFNQSVSDARYIRDIADSVDSTNIAAGAVGSSEIASTGVSAGSYGNATNTPQISIDADGRITVASEPTITALWASLLNVPSGFSDNVDNDTTYSNLSEFINDVGFITDYTVTEADVTQHEAAITITESQISDLQHTTDTNCSVDGSCGLITYDSELDYYTDADIDGTETAFDGWDKNAADDFDGAFGSLTSIPVGLSDGDDDTTYTASGLYILLSGTQFLLNETLLNATIEALDTDTQLNEAQVEAFIDGDETSFDGWDKNSADDFSGSFGDLTSIPSGLSDGDDDTTYSENDDYLTLSGTVFGFDESLLNTTIDARAGGGGSTTTSLPRANITDWYTPCSSVGTNVFLTGMNQTDDFCTRINYSDITDNLTLDFALDSRVDSLNTTSAINDLFVDDLTTDEDTTYSAGTGLDLSSTTFSILNAFQLPQSCSDGEIPEYNSTSGGWSCGVDNSAASGMGSFFFGDASSSTEITDAETIRVSAGTGITAVLTGNTVQINSTVVDTDTNLSGSSAGGDLSGTYPNPTISTGAVQDAEIDYSAVTLNDFTNDAGYALDSRLDSVNTTSNINSLFVDDLTTDDDTTYSESDPYLTLAGTVFGFDESALNATIDARDTNTQLTDEQVEDIAGAMVTGNTETRISVTYQDADGTFDFVVDDMNDDVPESGDFGNAADLEATGALSTGVVSDNEMDYTTVTLNDFTNDAGYLTSEVDGSTTNELQDLWDVFNADTGSTTANSQTDTLTVSGGTGIDTSISGDVLTITNTVTDTDTNLNEGEVEAFVFDADNTASLTTTGSLTAANFTATNGGAVADNSTCTIITSPSGTGRLEVCD